METCVSENDEVSLSCLDGQLVNVVNAVYGRLETEVAICSSQHFDTECSDNVLSIFSDRFVNAKVALMKNPW